MNGSRRELNLALLIRITKSSRANRAAETNQGRRNSIRSGAYSISQIPTCSSRAEGARRQGGSGRGFNIDSIPKEAITLNSTGTAMTVQCRSATGSQHLQYPTGHRRREQRQEPAAQIKRKRKRDPGTVGSQPFPDIAGRLIGRPEKRGGARVGAGNAGCEATGR